MHEHTLTSYIQDQTTLDRYSIL